MAFNKGERTTHLSAQDVRTNGLIVDVHVDAGNEYFTVALDDGREVQTVSGRLRKGEFTGYGRWQRILDQSSGCFYFFDESTNQTLWDTPEARDAVFSTGTTPPPGERASFRQQKHVSPLKNVSFSTDPPSVLKYDASGEAEDTYSSHSPSMLRSSPNQLSDNSQTLHQPKYSSEVQKSYSNPQSSVLSPPRDSSHNVPVEGKEARAIAISGSESLKQALMGAGAHAIAGHLRVLGIPVSDDDEYNTRKLAGILVTALSKLSLTIDDVDLNLLLKHVLGGPENHELADRLSHSSVITVPAPANKQMSFSKSFDDRHRQSTFAAESERSNMNFGVARYPDSNGLLARTPADSRHRKDYLDSSYDDLALTNQSDGHDASAFSSATMRENLMQVNANQSASPSSLPALNGRHSSREGSGSMQLKGQASPPTDVYLTPITPYTNQPIQYPVSYERASNLRDFQQMPMGIGVQKSEEISSRRFDTDSRVEYDQQWISSERVIEKSPEQALHESRRVRVPVEPYQDGRVYKHSDFRSTALVDPAAASYQAYPIRATARPYSSDNAVGSNPDAVKRRAELWSTMPPPKRPPPSGPPIYDQYRGTSARRARSEDLRTTLALETTKGYHSPYDSSLNRHGSQSFSAERTSTTKYDGDHLALPAASSLTRRLPTDSGNGKTNFYNDDDRVDITLYGHDDNVRRRSNDTSSPVRQFRQDIMQNDAYDAATENARPPSPSKRVVTKGETGVEKGIEDYEAIVDEERKLKELNEDEEIQKDKEELRHGLTDLNLSLDALLEHVASAGQRIDATWKPQHEDLHVEVDEEAVDDEAPTRAIKTRESRPSAERREIPVVPKQGSACGCIIS